MQRVSPREWDFAKVGENAEPDGQQDYFAHVIGAATWHQNYVLAMLKEEQLPIPGSGKWLSAGKYHW